VSDRKLSYQDLMEIIKLVEDSPQFQDFRLKYDDVEIELSKTGSNRPASLAPSAPTVSSSGASSAPAASVSTAASSTATPVVAAPAPAASPHEVPAGLVAVKAPMVGTFYRAPEPGAAPFVEVGAAVTKESVVCILEVMKLMNSLTAGIDGVVAQILVADGQTVEYGQPLVLIKPKG